VTEKRKRLQSYCYGRSLNPANTSCSSLAFSGPLGSHGGGPIESRIVLHSSKRTKIPSKRASLFSLAVPQTQNNGPIYYHGGHHCAHSALCRPLGVCVCGFSGAPKHKCDARNAAAAGQACALVLDMCWLTSRLIRGPFTSLHHARIPRHLWVPSELTKEHGKKGGHPFLRCHRLS